MIKKCSFCCEYKSLTDYYYSKFKKAYFSECKTCFKSRVSLDAIERRKFGKYRPKLVGDRTI